MSNNLSRFPVKPLSVFEGHKGAKLYSRLVAPGETVPGDTDETLSLPFPVQESE